MTRGDGRHSIRWDFGELFRRSYRQLCYFAIRYTGDEQQAEDAVHSVFARTMESDTTWESDLHARQYLFRAVRNECIDNAKSLDARRPLTEGAANDGDSRDFFAEIVRANIYDQIMKAVESLPDQRGAIFRMAFLDGMSNEEIAVHLSLSVNTVKSQKNKAKIQLRERLKGLYPIVALLLAL